MFRALRLIPYTAAITISIGGVARSDEIKDLGLTIAQTTVYRLAVPASYGHNSPLKVTSWVDHNDNTYRSGENVTVFVKVNKDAYVTIVNVGPSGNTTLLFPNQFQKDNFIKAGQTKRIPESNSPVKITVNGPAGSELVQVIASTDQRTVFQQTALKVSGGWHVVTADTAQWTRDLSLTMQGIPGSVTTVSAVRPANINQTSSPAEWDVYNKVIRTVASPNAAYQPPATSSGTVAATWTHTNTTNSTHPLSISLPKRNYYAGEQMPIQVITTRPCNLVVLNKNNQLIYPASGQPVLINANQPVVVTAVAGQISNGYVASCTPVMTTRAIGESESPEVVQIDYTIQ